MKLTSIQEKALPRAAGLTVGIAAALFATAAFGNSAPQKTLNVAKVAQRAPQQVAPKPAPVPSAKATVPKSNAVTAAKDAIVIGPGGDE